MNGSVKVDASKSGQGEISIEVEQPVVFAFEASSARYITNHLGSGPDDVSLTPIKPSDVKAAVNKAATAPIPWTEITERAILLEAEPRGLCFDPHTWTRKRI